MDAGDVAAIVIAAAVSIAAVGLLLTLGAALRAIATFRRSVHEITSQTLPLIADMHTAIKQANTDLMKVDNILENAESIQSTVDAASRLTYTAVSGPMVKLMALGAGITRGFSRLRGRSLPSGRADGSLRSGHAGPPGQG